MLGFKGYWDYVLKILTFLDQNCPTLKLNTIVRHKMLIEH